MNRLGLALLIVVLLGAGYWFWQDARRDARRAEVAASGQYARPSAAGGASAAAAKPLYRWRDAQGVLHVSDTPPEGVAYERVDIPEDQNVVPLTGPAPEPSN